MFGYFSDETIEEKVVRGLTNELVEKYYKDKLNACREEAKKLSDSLTPEERRFIAETKAKSIILPFSVKANLQKHLVKGDMVTLIDLLEIVEYIRKRGLTYCLPCKELHTEIERGKDKKLIVHVYTYDPVGCMHCIGKNNAGGFPPAISPPTHPKIEAELKLFD